LGEGAYTSKGEGREWEKERKGLARGKGREGRERADCESAKVATLKCGGPPTMPEENRGPWSKKFENRCPKEFSLLCVT